MNMSSHFPDVVRNLLYSHYLYATRQCSISIENPVTGDKWQIHPQDAKRNISLEQMDRRSNTPVFTLDEAGDVKVESLPSMDTMYTYTLDGGDVLPEFHLRTASSSRIDNKSVLIVEPPLLPPHESKIRTIYTTSVVDHHSFHVFTFHKMEEWNEEEKKFQSVADLPRLFERKMSLDPEVSDSWPYLKLVTRILTLEQQKMFPQMFGGILNRFAIPTGSLPSHQLEAIWKIRTKTEVVEYEKIVLGEQKGIWMDNMTHGGFLFYRGENTLCRASSAGRSYKDECRLFTQVLCLETLIKSMTSTPPQWEQIQTELSEMSIPDVYLIPPQEDDDDGASIRYEVVVSESRLSLTDTPINIPKSLSSPFPLVFKHALLLVESGGESKPSSVAWRIRSDLMHNTVMEQVTAMVKMNDPELFVRIYKHVDLKDELTGGVMIQKSCRRIVAEAITEAFPLLSDVDRNEQAIDVVFDEEFDQTFRAFMVSSRDAKTQAFHGRVHLIQIGELAQEWMSLHAVQEPPFKRARVTPSFSFSQSSNSPSELQNQIVSHLFDTLSHRLLVPLMKRVRSEWQEALQDEVRRILIPYRVSEHIHQIVKTFTTDGDVNEFLLKIIQQALNKSKGNEEKLQPILRDDKLKPFSDFMDMNLFSHQDLSNMMVVSSSMQRMVRDWIRKSATYRISECIATSSHGGGSGGKGKNLEKEEDNQFKSILSLSRSGGTCAAIAVAFMYHCLIRDELFRSLVLYPDAAFRYSFDRGDNNRVPLSQLTPEHYDCKFALVWNDTVQKYIYPNDDRKASQKTSHARLSIPVLEQIYEMMIVHRGIHAGNHNIEMVLSFAGNVEYDEKEVTGHWKDAHVQDWMQTSPFCRDLSLRLWGEPQSWPTDITRTPDQMKFVISNVSFRRHASSQYAILCVRYQMTTAYIPLRDRYRITFKELNKSFLDVMREGEEPERESLCNKEQAADSISDIKAQAAMGVDYLLSMNAKQSSAFGNQLLNILDEVKDKQYSKSMLIENFKRESLDWKGIDFKTELKWLKGRRSDSDLKQKFSQWITTASEDLRTHILLMDSIRSPCWSLYSNLFSTARLVISNLEQKRYLLMSSDGGKTSVSIPLCEVQHKVTVKQSSATKSQSAIVPLYVDLQTKHNYYLKGMLINQHDLRDLDVFIHLLRMAHSSRHVTEDKSELDVSLLSMKIQFGVIQPGTFELKSQYISDPNAIVRVAALMGYTQKVLQSSLPQASIITMVGNNGIEIKNGVLLIHVV